MNLSRSLDTSSSPVLHAVEMRRWRAPRANGLDDVLDISSAVKGADRLAELCVGAESACSKATDVRVHEVLDVVATMRIADGERVVLRVPTGATRRDRMAAAVRPERRAHRLSDDGATAVHEGDDVVLSWDADAASVLAGA